MLPQAQETAAGSWQPSHRTMGANLCSANIAQGAFASCAVCNTVDAADWIFCLDTRQAPIKKKRRAKDKYAKEAEEIDVERLEELTLELFKAHDLNDDGLLQESELITLNVRIAMLHHDKAAVELQDVRDTYQRLFRTKLDHLGRAVPFDTFRRYARGVLEELDHDPEAQEMILEQFVAEAKAGREFLDGAEDSEIRFPVAGQVHPVKLPEKPHIPGPGDVDILWPKDPNMPGIVEDPVCLTPRVPLSPGPLPDGI